MTLTKEQLRIAKMQDETLVCRFQRGDLIAFDGLMAAHTDKLFALAWGVLQNREDALDAVQEVFVKLYKVLPQFSSKDNLNAWLYRVCLNYCIDRKRRRKYTEYEMTDEDWDRLRGASRDEPEYRACQNEDGRLIREAVDGLPKRQRMVFILRHYNLLSLNEIADVMGCSLGATKAQLSRATAKLKRNLRGTSLCPERGGDDNEM